MKAGLSIRGVVASAALMVAGCGGAESEVSAEEPDARAVENSLTGLNPEPTQCFGGWVTYYFSDPGMTSLVGTEMCNCNQLWSNGMKTLYYYQGMKPRCTQPTELR